LPLRAAEIVREVPAVLAFDLRVRVDRAKRSGDRVSPDPSDSRQPP